MGRVECCKGCGAGIEWRKTINGKWTPFNPDGSTHWATCPKAIEFKKKPSNVGQKLLTDPPDRD